MEGEEHLYRAFRRNDPLGRGWSRVSFVYEQCSHESSSEEEEVLSTGKGTASKLPCRLNDTFDIGSFCGRTAARSSMTTSRRPCHWSVTSCWIAQWVMCWRGQVSGKWSEWLQRRIAKARQATRRYFYSLAVNHSSVQSVVVGWESSGERSDCAWQPESRWRRLSNSCWCSCSRRWSSISRSHPSDWRETGNAREFREYLNWRCESTDHWNLSRRTPWWVRKEHWAIDTWFMIQLTLLFV